jgi:hypothetical protein
VDSPQERKAANEAAFREINETMVGLQDAFAAEHGERLSIICECDQIGCAEHLQVLPNIYETVRADGACFLVCVGHEDSSVEDIVDVGPGYVIVRKRPGEPRIVALETDPRG